MKTVTSDVELYNNPLYIIIIGAVALCSLMTILLKCLSCEDEEERRRRENMELQAEVTGLCCEIICDTCVSSCNNDDDWNRLK